MTNSLRWWWAALLLVAAASSLRADTIQLSNGDTLNGRVVSLDAKTLRLRSEIHGELSVPRSKVAAIYFGSVKPPVAKPPLAAAAAQPAAVGTVQQALGALQGQGALNAQQMNDLQKLMPLLDTPEGQKLLTEKLNGLLTGTLSVEDIRRDAVTARRQITDLQKELGPAADPSLNSYLHLIDQFLQQTGPAKLAAPQPPHAKP